MYNSSFFDLVMKMRWSATLSIVDAQTYILEIRSYGENKDMIQYGNTQKELHVYAATARYHSLHQNITWTITLDIELRFPDSNVKNRQNKTVEQYQIHNHRKSCYWWVRFVLKISCWQQDQDEVQINPHVRGKKQTWFVVNIQAYIHGTKMIEHSWKDLMINIMQYLQYRWK